MRLKSVRRAAVLTSIVMCACSGSTQSPAAAASPSPAQTSLRTSPASFTVSCVQYPCGEKAPVYAVQGALDPAFGTPDCPPPDACGPLGEPASFARQAPLPTECHPAGGNPPFSINDACPITDRFRARALQLYASGVDPICRCTPAPVAVSLQPIGRTGRSIDELVRADFYFPKPFSVYVLVVVTQANSRWYVDDTYCDPLRPDATSVYVEPLVTCSTAANPAASSSR